MPTLPDVHRLVTIADADGRQFRSRVEDVDDRLWLLARPLSLPLEHQFEVGRLMFVSWPDPDGLTQATTKLLGARTRGTLGLWLVQQQGELRRQQRRRFVRVPAIGSIQLAAGGSTDGSPPLHVAGHLLDLSEAAARCTLTVAEAEQLDRATELLASFMLDDERFTVPAAMLRGEPSRTEDGLVEVIVTFELEEAKADVLRRRVFAEQVRLRRMQR